MIPRSLQTVIEKKLYSGKAIVLLGARQVGKTTLLRAVLRDRSFLFLDGDDPAVRSLLDRANTQQIRSIIGDHTMIFLDEAQRIPGIGLTLKIITDQFSHVQLLVSGSSSFDLGQELNEPLTGRKWEYTLLPVSWQEYQNHFGYLQAEQLVENRLLYGSYPEICMYPGQERERLQQLVNSYLYRDILAYANIRKPEVLERLLQALALQVGSEVNYNELAQTLGINKATVSAYIDVLEQGFVLFRLPGFSRNLRNEIKQNRKIYFWDTGVRNMVIGNFQPLELRPDKGALWENFLMAERRKYNMYFQPGARMYFWRTRQQQEIDYIEEYNGQLAAWEFKWQPRTIRFPATFVTTYQASTYQVHRQNFREFVCPREG